ncbi:Fur family transcriptional regulator [Maribacter polysiphoniae]|uniref:Fur family transcriptional regulator n=1 Tax=Maribacter polysiphoniae TaxID=429344 RepID=UPI002357967B|nr:transcriptional repressor [Maribacter polysiphoniae]
MKKRQTKSKKAVLNCLKCSDNYGLKAEEIENQLPQFDRVTIYRILQGFLDDGIIHKVISNDGKFYYFKCLNCSEIHYHNHYHFKCDQCGKVECMHNEIEVKVPKDYTVENVNFWITGVCALCKNN